MAEPNKLESEKDMDSDNSEPLTQPIEEGVTDTKDDLKATSNMDLTLNEENARNACIKVGIINSDSNQSKTIESGEWATTNKDINMQTKAETGTTLTLGENKTSEQVVGKALENLNANDDCPLKTYKSTNATNASGFHGSYNPQRKGMKDNFTEEQTNSNAHDNQEPVPADKTKEKVALPIPPTKNVQNHENSDSSHENVNLNDSIAFLEKKLAYLGVKFMAKEKEANAILKLMKLVEVELIQVKRQKDLKEIVQNYNGYQGNDYTKNEPEIVKKLLYKSISFKDPYVPVSLEKMTNEFSEMLESDKKNREEFNRMFETRDSTESKVTVVPRSNAKASTETVLNNDTAMHNLIGQALEMNPFSNNVDISEPHADILQSLERIGTRAIKKKKAGHQTSSDIRQERSVIPSTSTGVAGARKIHKIPKFGPTINYTDILAGLGKQFKTNSKKVIAKNSQQSPLENWERSQPQQHSHKNPFYATIVEQINSALSGGLMLPAVLTSETKNTPVKRLKTDPNISQPKACKIAKRVQLTETATHLTPGKPKIYYGKIGQKAVQNDRSGQDFRICQACGKSAMYVCSSCQNQWYCSTDCQMAAWTTHQADCVAP